MGTGSGFSALALAALAALLVFGGPPLQAQPADPAAADQPGRAQPPAAEAPLDRVSRLARRLLLANVERCPRQRWDYGFAAHRDAMPRVARPSAAAPPTAGPPAGPPAEPDGFGVLRVWPDSAAARAGIRPGDRVLAVNGADWNGPGFAELFRKTEQADPDLARITLGLARGEERLTIPLAGQRACAAYTLLVARDQVNASANASTIFVNRGLERALPDDDELSAVIAHEIAHIILGHDAALKARGPDRLTRSQAERDADALSVRLLLGAGIDPAIAARAIATIGRTGRGPITRLLGLYGPYLSTSARQSFLLAEAAAARSDMAKPVP